jgi:outer membrane protein
VQFIVIIIKKQINIKMNKSILLTLFSVFTIFGVNAQKFGYVNSQELLVSMPEVKAADSELEAFQKQLVTVGQNKMKDLQEEYNKYVEDSQKGVLSQVQAQSKEEELGKKNQELQAYEAEVQQKLTIKRETLYKPILDKVKAAIELYGKENSYTMIFDTSAGAILHALDSDNLMEPIKAKLK